MKKKIYLSWYCASCKKSGIAEVELPTSLLKMWDALTGQHRAGKKCKTSGVGFVEIRNVEVAVK